MTYVVDMNFEAYNRLRLARCFGAFFRKLLVLYCGREVEVKCCAAPRGAACPQMTAVGLDNRPANAKPHASAVGFGCKERIKNPFCELRRDPHAGVTD
jgi:hypothetical protein